MLSYTQIRNAFSSRKGCQFANVMARIGTDRMVLLCQKCQKLPGNTCSQIGYFCSDTHVFVFLLFQHNLCCDNCHSHVARALNLMKYDNSSSWNMVKLCFLMMIYSKCVRYCLFNYNNTIGRFGGAAARPFPQCLIFFIFMFFSRESGLNNRLMSGKSWTLPQDILS